MHCDCDLDATVIIAYLVCVLSLYLLSLSICGLFWLPRLEKEKKICVQYVVGNNQDVWFVQSPSCTLFSVQVCPQVEKYILGHLKTSLTN